MTLKILSVFMDTSVIFSAVLSSSGGARKLFQLGESGLLKLCVGPNVLRECEEVVSRKASYSLPRLAMLLSIGKVETCPTPGSKIIEFAKSLVEYGPDAHVLAEAIGANPDWFVTHDKLHLLKENIVPSLSFHIGTPGDLIQSIKDDLALP
jgi:predicted nucleic acid-binding protein